MRLPISLDEARKKVFETREIEEVMAEFAGNMGFKLEGLPAYGMRKVVSYAVCVTYAAMLGLPLELFKMTSEDIVERQRRLIEAADAAGIPTFIVGTEDE